jgi:hypothetical protein
VLLRDHTLSHRREVLLILIRIKRKLNTGLFAFNPGAIAHGRCLKLRHGDTLAHIPANSLYQHLRNPAHFWEIDPPGHNFALRPNFDSIPIAAHFEFIELHDWSVLFLNKPYDVLVALRDVFSDFVYFVHLLVQDGVQLAD